MRTIRRYQLATPGRPAAIPLPSGAHVVAVSMHLGAPHAWILVDEHAPRSLIYEITIHSTGAEIPDDAWHVATFFDDGKVRHAMCRMRPATQGSVNA